MINQIILVFKQNANDEVAVQMKAYMRHQFDFFGIKSPIRKEISKSIFVEVMLLGREEILTLVNQLWSESQRELHYLAQEIIFKCFKKKWEIGDIDFLENMAIQNSWWDTIDFIAPKLMANYFLQFPDQIVAYTQKWLCSQNKWLIRCAILFQLKYKEKTNLELLYKIILQCCSTDEFFINKAIGWVLRENSKRIPVEIRDFINFHEEQLSNLSKKEGLKLIC